MYPAEGFGTVDDLPDSINYTDNFTSFTLTKVEPFSYGGMTVYYVSDLELERYLGVSDEPIFDPGDCQNPGQTLGWVSGQGMQVTGQCCLISQAFDTSICNTGFIRDNFAGAYYLDSSGIPTDPDLCPSGYFSNNVTRGKYTGFEGENPDFYFEQGCCAWGSPYSNCNPPFPPQESDAKLFYNARGVDILGNGNDLNKWIISLGPNLDAIGIKTGNQNSPIGTYPTYVYSFGVQGSFMGNVVVS